MIVICVDVIVNNNIIACKNLFGWYCLRRCFSEILETLYYEVILTSIELRTVTLILVT